jgi:RNA polymerase primary sigma factor
MRQLKISGENITKRTENSSRYFTEVERNKLISPDEEWKIGIKAQQGDEDAIDALVKANLRFVISVAKQYAGTAERLEDLISQGNIGLIYAAKTFDPSRGFKFISYAVWHIRKEILLYLNSNLRQIRIPQNLIVGMSKINKVQDQLYQQEGRSATLDEIYDHLSKSEDNDFTIDRLYKIHNAMNQRTSPLENTEDPEGYSYLSVLSNTDSTSDRIENNDAKIVANLLFNELTPLHREIISRRLGFHDGHEWSFSQLGDMIGKTSENVRQIYNKAIKILKIKALRNPALKKQLRDLV